MTAALLLLLAACGGEASVSITPTTRTVEAGGSVTLTVTASNTRIIWPDGVPGTFTRDGNQVLYTPPAAAGRYDFTIVAAANDTKTATASIEVFVPPTPEINSFRVGTLPLGLIDHEARTIVISTQEWIDELDSLTAEYEAVGAVEVRGIPQVSGTTSNDFRNELRYTVSTGQYSRRTYTVRIESPQTTGLPVIRIDTQDQEEITSKEDYLQANIKVVDLLNPEYSLENTEYKDQVRGRGNTTWTYPKKPYRIKFDKKTSMFGLTAAKSWVLLANYQDPTLMLNSIAFELGQLFGLPYTNHYTHVELFLNGEYRGSYVLTEQVQTGEGRVDIDEDEGFLVELDVYFDEEPRFISSTYGLPTMIKSPEDLTDPSGYDFVKDAIETLEAAMSSPSFPDSGYRDLIATETFVDFLLTNEIVMNNEIWWPKSTYMYKDVGGKIGMGPLWDFDWGYDYSGFGHQYFTNADGLIQKHAFFLRLFDDPQFVAMYRAKWKSMHDQIAGMTGFISQLADHLWKSQEQNFLRWPETRNNGYAREIGDLSDWWGRRIEFLKMTLDGDE